MAASANDHEVWDGVGVKSVDLELWASTATAPGASQGAAYYRLMMEMLNND